MSDEIQPHPQPVPSETPVDRKPLPFNFESGFGGVDASDYLYSQDAIRSGLFDFGGAPRKRKTVQWSSAPGVAEQYASVEFDVPAALDFSWSAEDITETRAGATRASFQSDVTESLTGSASGFGFGAEFAKTFAVHHFNETYEKYVARYERQQIYRIAFHGDADVRRCLSARAQSDLDNATASDIVQFYGTHYMHSATFGGLKVYSSHLDVRDEVTATDLKTAMSLKFDSAKGSASGGASSDTRTVQKLHSRMSVTEGRTIGGEPSEGDPDKWRHSLFTNPAVIGYELRPISELAPQARRAEIDAEVARRLRAGGVKADAQMLAMRVPIAYLANDHMSGATKSITVARPSYRYGWFYVGQWALPAREFPAGYETLIFSNLPGTKDRPALKPATGFDEIWSTKEGGGMGLFKAKPIAGYTAVGDMWHDTQYASHIPDVGFYGLVRDDLLKPSTWLNPNDTFWDDHGTHLSAMGGVYTFAAGETPDPPAEQMLWVPSSGSQAYMFRAANDYGTHGEPVQIDMAKVCIVANAWLD